MLLSLLTVNLHLPLNASLHFQTSGELSKPYNVVCMPPVSAMILEIHSRKCSEAEENPKGKMSQGHLLKSVMRDVRGADSSRYSICQNPDVMSNL